MSERNGRVGSHPRLRVGLGAWLCCGSVLLVSCGGALETTRRHTYAPEFNYITDSQLQSAMWQLAAGTSSLDKLLATGVPVTLEERQSVIRILQNMETAAASLGPDGWPSNHPRIAQNIGRFREQLAGARRNVQLDPPSYYLAGTISGACHACHGGE